MPPLRIREVLGKVLAIALTVAAATAIFSLLKGSFDDTDARVIGMAFGFAVFTSTAAAGEAGRSATRADARAAGAATIVLSAVAFLALVLAIWSDDSADTPWEVWGVIAVLTYLGSHVSLTLAAERPADSSTVATLAGISIVAAGILAAAAIGAITGLYDDYDEGAGKFVAVVAILWLLTSALAPLLRRMSGDGRAPGAQSRGRSPVQRLASEVYETTGRIASLDPPPEVRAECERLRKRARELSGPLPADS